MFDGIVFANALSWWQLRQADDAADSECGLYLSEVSMMSWKRIALLASTAAGIALITADAWATSGTDLDAKYGTGMTLIEGLGGGLAGLGVATAIAGWRFHNHAIMSSGAASIAGGALLAKDRQTLGLFNLGTTLDGSSLLGALPADPLTWVIDTASRLWTLLF